MTAIFVNGVKHRFPEELIEWNDIKQLADPHDEKGLLIVKYYYIDHADMYRSGYLEPGKDRIAVVEGMRFAAIHSGGA